MYKSGDWLAICDQCGVRAMASELTKRWDNRMVHRPEIREGCWETRHPQEFVRAKPDNQPLPWTRPEVEEIEQEVPYISQVTDAPHDEIPSGTFGDYSPES